MRIYPESRTECGWLGHRVNPLRGDERMLIDLPPVTGLEFRPVRPAGPSYAPRVRPPKFCAPHPGSWPQSRTRRPGQATPSARRGPPLGEGAPAIATTTKVVSSAAGTLADVLFMRRHGRNRCIHRYSRPISTARRLNIACKFDSNGFAGSLNSGRPDQDRDSVSASAGTTESSQTAHRY